MIEEGGESRWGKKEGEEKEGGKNFHA